MADRKAEVVAKLNIKPKKWTIEELEHVLREAGIVIAPKEQ